jgi:hypothetical protein
LLALNGYTVAGNAVVNGNVTRNLMHLPVLSTRLRIT